MLRLFTHLVACCWVLLEIDGQSLRPVALEATCKRMQEFPKLLCKKTQLRNKRNVGTFWSKSLTVSNFAQKHAKQGVQTDVTYNRQQSCVRLEGALQLLPYRRLKLVLACPGIYLDRSYNL